MLTTCYVVCSLYNHYYCKDGNVQIEVYRARKKSGRREPTREREREEIERE